MIAIWICLLRERRRGLMDKWTVWVGGSEVNLVYLSEAQAQNMAQAWKDRGYDDVKIEKVSNG
jgi:hypothetical protein